MGECIENLRKTKLGSQLASSETTIKRTKKSKGELSGTPPPRDNAEVTVKTLVTCKDAFQVTSLVLMTRKPQSWQRLLTFAVYWDWFKTKEMMAGNSCCTPEQRIFVQSDLAWKRSTIVKPSYLCHLPLGSSMEFDSPLLSFPMCN